MDEQQIKALLDQLGEFEAQKTLLEMDKRNLLEAVKVPEEVRSLQERNNQRKAQIDAEYIELERASSEEQDEAMKSIVVPAEILALFREIERQQSELALKYIHQRGARLAAINARKAEIDAEFMAQVQGVYQAIEQRKLEINSEFGEKSSAVETNIKALTDQIKRAAGEAGASVKGKYYHAVYVKGRVTWNTDMLDGLAIQLPALNQARKVGEPSVTLRKV